MSIDKDIPTDEAADVEECPRQDAPEPPGPTETGHRGKGPSREAGMALAAGALAVAAAVAAGAFLLSNDPAPAPEGDPAGAAQAGDAEAECAAEVGLEGYRAAEGATPVIVHVKGADESNSDVDFYHAVEGGSEQLPVREGAYTFRYVPVINPDGGLVTAGDVEAIVEGGSSPCKSEAAARPADQVTPDEMQDALDQVAEAVKKGDGTLKGDAGKDIVEKAAQNAVASGKVDQGRADEAKKEGQQAAEQPSTAGSDGGHEPAVAPSGSQGATVPAAPSSGGSQAASGSQQSGEEARPAHSHSWAPVYRTETSAVTVTDREAYTSHEYVGSTWHCNTCGYECSSEDAIEAHIFSYDQIHSYSVKTNYQDVYHPAVTHQETVQSQVLDHYECLGCGARK